MNEIKKDSIPVRYIGYFALLVGVVSGLIGIYAFLVDKRPQVNFEVLSNISVLDINADLTNLDISYNGESLKRNGQSVRVISVRVKNTGSDNILKNSYDLNDPVGIDISEGNILENPELIHGSNNYIVNNLRMTVVGSNSVTFNDIILEQSEYFDFKLLVLHGTGTVPGISSRGKIAGVREILVLPFDKDLKNEPSFLARTFGGGVLSNLVRAIVYTIVVIVLLFGFIGAALQVSEIRDKGKRKRLVKAFKNETSYTYSQIDYPIFAAFEKGDKRKDLSRFREFLKNESRLNYRYRSGLKRLKQVGESDTSIHESLQPSVNEDKLFLSWGIIRRLIDDGYVIENGGSLVVNQPMKNTLDRFLDYLDSVDYNYEKHFSISGIDTKRVIQLEDNIAWNDEPEPKSE